MMKVRVFSGKQGKHDSIIVVAQLSPEFTAAHVNRWIELESALVKPVQQPVNLNDLASSRGLLLRYTEQMLKLEHKFEVQRNHP